MKKTYRTKCPKCGEYSYQKVIYSKTNKINFILRRKHCLNCNYRFYTLQNPETAITLNESKYYYFVNNF